MKFGKYSRKHKPTFSSSTLLFFGIFVEDVPQLIVTFLIEDKIKSDDPGGRISGTAMVNLTFAIFDILHKVAKACDLLSDVHNAGYTYKKWFKAHNDFVSSLAIAGVNWILSASRDKTVKLWNTTNGKLKHTQNTVAIGSSRIIAACWGWKICVFDFEKGEALGSPIDLWSEPSFISLSYDSKFVLTFANNASSIQSFDLETNAPLSTSSQGAGALTFLDDNLFISSKYTQSMAYAFVWNMNESEPTHTIELEHLIK